MSKSFFINITIRGPL